MTVYRSCATLRCQARRCFRVRAVTAGPVPPTTAPYWAHFCSTNDFDGSCPAGYASAICFCVIAIFLYHVMVRRLRAGCERDCKGA